MEIYKIFQIINFNHKFAIFGDPIKKKTLLAYLSSSFLQTPKQQKPITQNSIFINIFSIFLETKLKNSKTP